MTADTLTATSPGDAKAITYPDGWRVVRLDAISRVGIGRTPARDCREYWDDGVVSWVAISDLDGGVITRTKERISANAHASIFRRQLVAVGTILVSFKLTIGKIGILGIPAVHNEAIANLTLTSDTVDRDYLALFLESLDYSVYLDTYVKGKTLNKDKLNSLRIALPPLPEQRAISRVLRAAQEAIAARRRQVTLERERKAALMQRLFTHGVRGEPTRQTEIGQMPQSWQVVRFSEVVDIVQGQVDPRIEPYRSMLHVGPENIEEGTGQIISARTAGDLNLISGKYLFSPDHVLYSKIRPYLRKAAIPWFDGICSADMYPLKPHVNQIERDFLLYALLGESFTAQVTASQDRTGIPKVNRNQLGAVRLPLPSLVEQRAIAVVLAACDTHIAALEREIALHDELFRALLEELMSGRLSALGLAERDDAMSAPA